MPVRHKRQTQSTVVMLEKEPGNGSRYEAIGVFLPETQQWLVSFPLYGVGYVFSPGAYTTVDYVREKLDRRGDIPEADLHEMTKMISDIVRGRDSAQTDATGRFSATHLSLAQ